MKVHKLIKLLECFDDDLDVLDTDGFCVEGVDVMWWSDKHEVLLELDNVDESLSKLESDDPNCGTVIVLKSLR